MSEPKTPRTDPIDAFLNMLPGSLPEDREIVAALDRLIYSERTQALTQWLSSDAAEKALAEAYWTKGMAPKDAAKLPLSGESDERQRDFHAEAKFALLALKDALTGKEGKG